MKRPDYVLTVDRDSSEDYLREANKKIDEYNKYILGHSEGKDRGRPDTFVKRLLGDTVIDKIKELVEAPFIEYAVVDYMNERAVAVKFYNYRDKRYSVFDDIYTNEKETLSEFDSVLTILKDL